MVVRYISSFTCFIEVKINIEIDTDMMVTGWLCW